MDNQEQNWIQSARNGDQAAFGELVMKYQKRVYALTVRMCPTPELAEEAAQEAFLSAWQGLPFFRGDSAFSTWLYRLASNACVDLLRKESRHQGPSLDDEAISAEVPDTRPTPEAAAEQKELRAQIEAGLRTLSPEHLRPLRRRSRGGGARPGRQCPVAHGLWLPGGRTEHLGPGPRAGEGRRPHGGQGGVPLCHRGGGGLYP